MTDAGLRVKIVDALLRHCYGCAHGGDTHIREPEADYLADAVMPIVEAALWRSRNLVNGKCRYCRHGSDPSAEHRMECRFYVGPLAHRWERKGWNGTFGGVDHFCVCGGWFRQGGMAGHGDGSVNADAVCPNAAESWRGPRDGGES